MSEFIPGPWRAMGDGAIRTAAGTRVATVAIEDETPITREATALVIAIAPELHQLIADQITAMSVAPMSDMNYAGIDWMHRAQRVLAKAEPR
jgi:hypothetical protein